MSLQNINSYTYTPGFTQGQYHNAVLCISGNVQSLYLNGVLVGSTTTASNILSYYPTINQILVGCAGDKSNGFTGYLDDFRIYKYAFNQSQVSNLYSNRNLIAYYPFDVCFNNVANNINTTGNNATLAYDATLVGNATISTTTDNYLIGSGALNLTNTAGVTSIAYVNSTCGFSTTATNQVSISLWFKTTGISGRKMRLFDLCPATGSQGIFVDISGTNGINTLSNSYVVPEVIAIPTNINITFTSNGSLSTNPTYNSISLNDFGKVIVGTSTGVHYMSYSNGSFSNFVQSDLTVDIISVHMNNSGIGLACSTTTLYYTSNSGKNWTPTTLTPVKTPATSGYYYSQVFVTQTGSSYVGVSNSIAVTSRTASYIYKSNDFFNTSSTQHYNISSSNMGFFSFASNGFGIVMIYNTGSYFYNGTSWSGLVNSNSSYCSISDNGKYSLGPYGSTLYYSTNITSSGVPSLSANVSPRNLNGFSCIGNNGLGITHDNTSGFQYIYNTLNNKSTYTNTPTNSNVILYFKFNISYSGSLMGIIGNNNKIYIVTTETYL